MQIAIVSLALLVAAFYLLGRLRRTLSGKGSCGCGCSCSGCASIKNCSSVGSCSCGGAMPIREKLD